MKLQSGTGEERRSTKVQTKEITFLHHCHLRPLPKVHFKKLPTQRGFRFCFISNLRRLQTASAQTNTRPTVKTKLNCLYFVKNKVQHSRKSWRAKFSWFVLVFPKNVQVEQCFKLTNVFMIQQEHA